MRKKSLYVLTSLLLLVIIPASVYSVVRLRALGAFYIAEDGLSQWNVIQKQVPGPEAIQLDHDSGMLYFISHEFCSSNPEPGTIYYLDLNQDTLEPLEFSISGPEDFHPHGLSYFKSSSAMQYLFTNNHRKDGTHTVEVFEIVNPARLKHISTVQSDLLTSPNDLVAVSPNQFYITNDGRSHNTSSRAIDAFFNIRGGQVLFYDGDKLKVVVDRLNFPNGITYHQASMRLFVAESLSGQISTYYRLENNRLQPGNSISLATGIDNLSLNGNQLVLASHPNLLALSKYKKNQDYASPSVVYSLSLDLAKSEVIFESSGESISGVSAAVRYRQYLILGNVCRGLMICRKKQ